MIPRWRSVRRTVAAGEFQRLQNAHALPASAAAEVERLRGRWRDVGTPLSAAELTGALVVAGNLDEAQQPASFILNDENPTYRRLAKRILEPERKLRGEDDVKLHAASELIDLFRSKIVESKRRLERDPRNPIAWADLARRYTALGQFDRADEALRIARALAPDSRYLLRVSSRFYVHIGRASSAVGLLRSSARTNEDPWLMAALMSAATVARKPLPGTRVARRIIESGNFMPIENSDLVSELGTLELNAGADRRARKLFVESLEVPTDNSLAQVEWASHKLASLDVEVDSFDEVAYPAEALARSASQRGDWKLAFGQSLQWLADQPFDTEAATHASYVAAVGLEDWQDSRTLAEIGLCSNPNDATLANNLAYACIEMGDLASAADPLALASMNATERPERIAVLATSGLMQFRLGNAEEGRRSYQKAIDLARRLNEPDAEAMARSMLMREEVTAGDLEAARKILGALDKVASGVADAGVARCVERARQLLGSVLPDRQPEPEATMRPQALG